MPSRILKTAAVALAIAGTASAATHYTLDSSDDYTGADFFDMFDFFTDTDPTAGYVDYKSQSAAAAAGLIKVTNGQNYMGVDFTNTISNTARGRPSVRIQSKSIYNHGLFIADLAHMPASVCGTWPAFWTAGFANSPADGEIDILENISENIVSLETLHTPGFTVAGKKLDPDNQSADETTYNCDDAATTGPFGTTQYLNQGCSAANTNPNSYGTPFNTAGGGVYAMEWTSDYIKIWNFGANSIPSDITSGTPNPSGWGTPAFSTVGGTGSVDAHFKNHNMVIDTTFCGNWAGQQAIWEATTCYAATGLSCNAYVQNHPSVYKDAYWLINSVKVYKLTPIVVSSSSSTAAPTTAPTTAPTSASVSPTTKPFSNSTTTSGDPGLTTSVVYTTTVRTITSCAPTVTNCPARVVTDVIPLYTTICPIAQAQATKAASVTSTVYTTLTYTVTKCPSTVTNCPLGHVTTEVVPLYTTVCPVEEAGSKATGAAAPAASTMKPVASAYSNSTTAGSPSALTTSGASELKIGGFLAIFIAAVVLMI